MKRRYEIARAEARRNHLALRVMVFEVGTCWAFDLQVPYSSVDARSIYEAAALEDERQMAWERRQRERLDDSLF